MKKCKQTWATWLFLKRLSLWFDSPLLASPGKPPVGYSPSVFSHSSLAAVGE